MQTANQCFKVSSDQEDIRKVIDEAVSAQDSWLQMQQEAKQKSEKGLAELKAKGASVYGVLTNGGWKTTLVSVKEWKKIVSQNTTPLVPAKCGVHLAIRQEKPGANDNQTATWLMVDPASGLAPSSWQSMVGPATVVRVDGRPYTKDDHTVVHDWISFLLDVWGSEKRPTGLLKVYQFQRFAYKKYVDSKLNNSVPLILLPAVQLKGLRKAPHLNGKIGFKGEIVTVDKSELSNNRWAVYMKEGQFRVKARNMNEIPKPENVAKLLSQGY